MNLDPAVPVYGASTPQNVLTQPATPGETPVAVPDYRVATPLVPSGPPTEAVSPSSNPPANASATPTVGGFAYGVEPSAAVAGPSISVADAAAQYKANKGSMKSRVIDNQSISTLDKNPSGLVTASELTMPQSDISPGPAASPTHAKPEFAASGDVLDQRDLAAVEAAVRRGQMQGANASTNEAGSASAAQPEANTAPTPSAQADREADVQKPDASRQSTEQESDRKKPSRDRLPESSSALPILGIMGLLTIVGGALSVWRSRA